MRRPEERGLGSAIGKHIRSNVVAYIALVLALSGTATALQGKNTVFSDDIAKRQVKKPDVGANAVGTGKMLDGHVSNVDLGEGAIGAAHVLDGNLTGAHVDNDSLTGAEITGLTGADLDESTLATVPRATVAGIGRSAQQASCDPETTAVVCASVTLTLPANGPVLMNAFGTGYTEADSDRAGGTCFPDTSATGNGQATGVLADDNSAGEFGFSWVTPPVGPGAVTFTVMCSQHPTVGAIVFEKVSVSVFQIGSS